MPVDEQPGSARCAKTVLAFAGALPSLSYEGIFDLEPQRRQLKTLGHIRNQMAHRLEPDVESSLRKFVTQGRELDFQGGQPGDGAVGYFREYTPDPRWDARNSDQRIQLLKETFARLILELDSLRLATQEEPNLFFTWAKE